MPRNEDGEFELVLGNRQLLSMFFIVVVLLGVFFTMGYIVGRNSSPASDLAKRPDATNTIVVDKQAEGTKPEPSTAPPVQEPPAAPAPAPYEARPAETPQQAPAESKRPPAKIESPKPTRTEPAKAEAAKPAGDPGQAAEPPKGTTWLQVMAVGHTDAELMIGVLRKKGFSATMAPSNNELLFRVLVGPLADSAAVSKTRSDLKDAGFKDAIVKKY